MIFSTFIFGLFKHVTFFQSMSYIFVFTIISTIHSTNYYYYLYKYMMFYSIGVNLGFSPFFCLKKTKTLC